MSCPTKQIPPTGRPPPINESIDGIPLMEKKLKNDYFEFYLLISRGYIGKPLFLCPPLELTFFSF